MLVQKTVRERQATHLDGRVSVATFWIHMCIALVLHWPMHVCFFARPSLYTFICRPMLNDVTYTGQCVHVNTVAHAYIVHVFREGPFCGLTSVHIEALAGSLIASAIWADGSMGLRKSFA